MLTIGRYEISPCLLPDNLISDGLCNTDGIIIDETTIYHQTSMENDSEQKENVPIHDPIQSNISDVSLLRPLPRNLSLPIFDISSHISTTPNSTNTAMPTAVSRQLPFPLSTAVNTSMSTIFPRQTPLPSFNMDSPSVPMQILVHVPISSSTSNVITSSTSAPMSPQRAAILRNPLHWTTATDNWYPCTNICTFSLNFDFEIQN